MRKLKLVNNKDKIYLDYEEDYFLIRTIEDWNMIVNFTEAYLIFSIPGFSILEKNIKTEVNRKFIDFQNYKLVNNLDFSEKSLNSWNFFNGIMEGNNKSIKCSNKIFKEINRAVIRNLIIDNNNLIAETIHLSELDNIKSNNCLSETFSGIINNLLIECEIINPICNIFYGEIINSNIINKSKEVKLFNINKGRIENCNFTNLLVDNNIYNSKIYKEKELYIIFDENGKIEKKEIIENTDELFISVYENTGIDKSKETSEVSTESRNIKANINLLRLKPRIIKR